MPRNDYDMAPVKVALHRNETSNVTKAVTDLTVNYYMNVGSWGDNGKSDFALVSGRVMVLGSWLGSDGANEIPPSDELIKSKVGHNDKIADFFIEAQKSKRGFFRDVVVINAPEYKFAEESELLVVLGDCHINVLKEWGPDNFVRIPDYDIACELNPPTRISMWQYFKEFIDFASPQTTKKNFVQIGDLYDIWEAQNIFEYAAHILLNQMESFNRDAIVGNGGPTRKDFLPELLSFSDRFQREENREFNWLRGSKKLLSKKDKLPLTLARYFGIPDPEPIEKAPLVDYVQPVDGPCEANEDYVEEYQYTDEHDSLLIDWRKSARQKFYEFKPTLRDALALIFYGDTSQGNSYPLSPMATPTQFKIEGEAGLQNELHFVAQCEKLGDKDKKVDFLSCEAIKRLIEAQYEDAASTFAKMTLVVGNHDISDADEGGKYKNHYLELLFREGKTREDVLKLVTSEGAKNNIVINGTDCSQANRMDPDCNLTDGYITHRRGVNDKIVIEHGMSWDVYNNPINYSLLLVNATNPLSIFNPISAPETGNSGVSTDWKWLDGGYHACRGWTVGDPYSVMTPYNGDMYDSDAFGASEAGKRVVLPQADFELGIACEARMDGIFEKNRDKVSLVMMGHTHDPFIISWHKWKWALRNTIGVSPIVTSIEGIWQAFPSLLYKYGTSPAEVE
ncbi:MAG: hypothetical protein AB8B55_15815 [Mariniblastus sp.]